MVRTSQRYVPVVLFAIAVLLVGARIASHLLTKREQAQTTKTGLVKWVSIDEGLRLARATGKPILIDFTAEWCQPCHVLDAEVFQNAEIAKKINQRFVAVRVTDRQQEDGQNTPRVAELQQRFKVQGFPTVVFTGGSLNELGRMEGFRGRAHFEELMGRVR
jgi:thiol:disulfide interchange protein